MSNYIMLISDKEMQINTEFKEIALPDTIKKHLSFQGKYGYILNPIASDRKEIIAKQMSPDFYKNTSEWFDEIYFAVQKILNQKNKVALIETYYNQKLDEVIWNFETFIVFVVELSDDKQQMVKYARWGSFGDNLLEELYELELEAENELL